MNRIRMSIAGLMAVVFCIALAFASLLNAATPLWASGLFMFTVALLSAAILGTAASRGRTRMTWAGLAVFGWVYLGIVFGPFNNGNATTIPALPVMAFYEYFLYHNTIPKAKAEFKDVRFQNTSQAESLLHDPSGVGKGPRVLVDVMNLKRIVHSLGAILFALLGGLFGRILYYLND